MLVLYGKTEKCKGKGKFGSIKIDIFGIYEELFLFKENIIDIYSKYIV